MTNIRLLFFLLLLTSCGSLKHRETVILRLQSDDPRVEVTLVKSGNAKMNCMDENLFSVRLNGKPSKEIVISCIGCVLTASKENGWYQIRCFCNDNTKVQKINVLSRQSKKIIATFELDLLLMNG
jgi:hypothetical protein